MWRCHATARGSSCIRSLPASRERGRRRLLAGSSTFLVFPPARLFPPLLACFFFLALPTASFTLLMNDTSRGLIISEERNTPAPATRRSTPSWERFIYQAPDGSHAGRQVSGQARPGINRAYSIPFSTCAPICTVTAIHPPVSCTPRNAFSNIDDRLRRAIAPGTRMNTPEAVAGIPGLPETLA